MKALQSVLVSPLPSRCAMRCVSEVGTCKNTPCINQRVHHDIAGDTTSQASQASQASQVDKGSLSLRMHRADRMTLVARRFKTFVADCHQLSIQPISNRWFSQVSRRMLRDMYSNLRKTTFDNGCLPES